MKVLITGATGLIGKALSVRLLSEGYHIHYLTTGKSKIKSTPECKGFYWNPAKKEIDIEAFKDVSVIINLAGSSIAKRWTKSYKKQVLDSRIDSLQVLYDAIKSNNLSVDHLISSSAIGYYPNSLTQYYTEEYVSTDVSFLSKVVQDWEAAADKFKSLGIKVSCVRTGIVLSDEEGAFSKLVNPIQKYAGAPLGSGDQWQSWIHINDIVGIYQHILKNKLEGIFNGVAPNAVTQTNLTKAIAKTLQKPLILPKIPTFVLKTLLGEMHVIVTQGQRVSAEKIKHTGYNFEYFEVNDALKNLLA